MKAARVSYLLGVAHGRIMHAQERINRGEDASAELTDAIRTLQRAEQYLLNRDLAKPVLAWIDPNWRKKT